MDAGGLCVTMAGLQPTLPWLVVSLGLLAPVVHAGGQVPVPGKIILNVLLTEASFLVLVGLLLEILKWGCYCQPGSTNLDQLLLEILKWGCYWQPGSTNLDQLLLEILKWGCYWQPGSTTLDQLLLASTKHY